MKFKKKQKKQNMSHPNPCNIFTRIFFQISSDPLPTGWRILVPTQMLSWLHLHNYISVPLSFSHSTVTADETITKKLIIIIKKQKQVIG